MGKLNKKQIQIRNTIPKLHCNKCGSHFQLEYSHYQNCGHKSREHTKDCPTEVLCKTCHYFKDFKQNTKLYYWSKMKKYNLNCQDIENRRKKIEEWENRTGKIFIKFEKEAQK